MITILRILPIAISIPMTPAAGVANSSYAEPVPGFVQLESSYRTNGNLQQASYALDNALPVGTNLLRAQQSLERVGATCKTHSRDRNEIDCLVRQAFLIEEGATVIRWTILLHGYAGSLSSIDVNRYVDRHRRG